VVQYAGASKRLGRLSSWIRPRLQDQEGYEKVLVQCQALTEVSIVSVNVTDSMIDRFSENVTTARALTMARGVEGCCTQIIKSQSTIRQSVLLASEILKLKPAVDTMDAKAKVMWTAVDQGIVRILQTAIDMTRATSVYFSYFLRFRQSLQYYEGNQDKSLATSLEYLKKDCREFDTFRKAFVQTVAQLNTEAMECIKQCVATQIGAGRFEAARSQRARTRDIFLAKQQICDTERARLQKVFEDKQQRRNDTSANIERLKYKMEQLKVTIEEDKKLKARYVDTKQELDNIKTIVK